MFLNLLSLIIIYLFFFTIIFSYGRFLNNHVLKIFNLSLGETGIIGFIFIYFIILIFHFFISINDFFILFFYLFSISYFFYDFKYNLKYKFFYSSIFLSLFLIFIILSITNNHHDDLYIFQLPIINYIQNYKIIFGLINLNDFIGQGHSFYEIMSAFKVPYFGNRAYYLLPIIFLNFFVIYLLEQLQNHKKEFLINFFIYLIFIILFIRFNRTKEFGTDLPILCLIFYIQINFFKFIEKKNFDLFLKSILAFVFALILKLYSIFSFFYLLAFIFLLKKKTLEILKKRFFLIFVTSLFLLTLIKNIIVSGCVFYPIYQTCFDKKIFHWSISREVAFERYKFYNAQVFGWRSYTKNLNNKKFIAAEDYQKKKIFEKYHAIVLDKDIEKILAGIFINFVFFITLFYCQKKKNISLLKYKKYILFIIFLPLAFWLIKIPQSRYGFYAYISGLSYFVYFYFITCKSIFLKKKIILKIFLIMIIFLITKNFIRIAKEIKVENVDLKNYPIKEFRISKYKSTKINSIKINIPSDFMECSNIPMPCTAKKEMIKKITIFYDYVFVEGSTQGMKNFIKSSAYYDMIETNN